METGGGGIGNNAICVALRRCVLLSGIGGAVPKKNNCFLCLIRWYLRPF